MAVPVIVRSARAATVVKFGQIELLPDFPLQFGLRARDGAKMAVKAINATGGFQDTKGNTYTIDLHADDMADDARR